MWSQIWLFWNPRTLQTTHSKSSIITGSNYSYHHKWMSTPMLFQTGRVVRFSSNLHHILSTYPLKQTGWTMHLSSTAGISPTFDLFLMFLKMPCVRRNISLAFIGFFPTTSWSDFLTNNPVDNTEKPPRDTNITLHKAIQTWYTNGIYCQWVLIHVFYALPSIFLQNQQTSVTTTLRKLMAGSWSHHPEISPSGASRSFSGCMDKPNDKRLTIKSPGELQQFHQPHQPPMSMNKIKHLNFDEASTIFHLRLLISYI